MNFRISPHAAQELTERGIDPESLYAVLHNPEQIVPEHDGRVAYQSRMTLASGKVHLVRAIVDPGEDEALVVTVYRTSRIAKYWRQS